jgi:hypothetical protein
MIHDLRMAPPGAAIQADPPPAVRPSRLRLADGAERAYRTFTRGPRQPAPNGMDVCVKPDIVLQRDTLARAILDEVVPRRVRSPTRRRLLHAPALRRCGLA